MERRNQIRNNLVLRVRQPRQPLLDSDRPNFTRGPAGFWLTNPDNTVTGNLAADAEGNGFWLAFPTEPQGLSSAVAMRPNRLPFGVFDDNTTHSNGTVGIQLDWVPFNAAGETRPQSYAPSSDGGAAGPYANWTRMPMRRISTFKNRDSGFWNRVTQPDYENWVSADNLGVFFAGAGSDGNITRSLLVGESLNRATTWQQVVPNWQTHFRSPVPVAFASYHSTFNLHHNTVVNFPFTPGYASGTFKTDDYYITAVDKGLVRNPANQLIASHPGYRYPVQTDENWTLAGALWDPHGYWGPAGNFWVYDTPFLSAGQNCQPVEPAGQNGLSCAGEYYGIEGFVVDQSERYRPLMPIQATRYGDDNQVIGSWAVGDGQLAPMLGNMRHFAAVRGGRYLLDFPGISVPSQQVELEITNAYRPEDTLLLGVRFSGSVAPRVSLRQRSNTFALSAVAPEALSQPEPGFWQDSDQQIVWVRLRAPLPARQPQPGEANQDAFLYQNYTLRIAAP